MGRLAMHIIEQSLKVKTARMLGWDAIQKLDRNVDAVYHLERPDRSLRIKMETVRPLEEQHGVYVDKVYDGPFLQFKRYIVNILDNHGIEERKQ
jgi:hypothetical protein